MPTDNNKIKAFDCDQIRLLNKDQSIRSVCSGHFHYALESGIEDKYSQDVEDAFGNLETWYGDNIERIEKSLLNKRVFLIQIDLEFLSVISKVLL